jgi:hypothetical protein
MPKVFFLLTSVGFVLALFISSSRGDVEPIDESSDEEPIIGDPIVPLPGSEEVPVDPSREPDPETVWRYEILTAAEKAVMDRGLADDQGAVQAAYAAASADLADQAKAERAAILMGIDVPLDCPAHHLRDCLRAA